LGLAFYAPVREQLALARLMHRHGDEADEVAAEGGASMPLTAAGARSSPHSARREREVVGADGELGMMVLMDCVESVPVAHMVRSQTSP